MRTLFTMIALGGIALPGNVQGTATLNISKGIVIFSSRAISNFPSGSWLRGG